MCMALPQWFRRWFRRCPGGGAGLCALCDGDDAISVWLNSWSLEFPVGRLFSSSRHSDENPPECDAGPRLEDIPNVRSALFSFRVFSDIRRHWHRYRIGSCHDLSRPTARPAGQPGLQASPASRICAGAAVAGVARGLCLCTLACRVRGSSTYSTRRSGPAPTARSIYFGGYLTFGDVDKAAERSARRSSPRGRRG